jgi:hypothetical protein
MGDLTENCRLFGTFYGYQRTLQRVQLTVSAAQHLTGAAAAGRACFPYFLLQLLLPPSQRRGFSVIAAEKFDCFVTGSALASDMQNHLPRNARVKLLSAQAGACIQ